MGIIFVAIQLRLHEKPISSANITRMTWEIIHNFRTCIKYKLRGDYGIKLNTGEMPQKNGYQSCWQGGTFVRDKH